MTALVYESFVGDRMTFEAVGGYSIDISTWAEHASCNAFGNALLTMRFGFGIACRSTIITVDIDKIPAGTVAGLTRNARHGSCLVTTNGGRVVASKTQAFPFGESKTHVVQNILGFL